MDLDDLAKSILLDCIEDDVSLWNIITRISSDHRGDYPPPPWLLEQTLAVIRGLVDANLIEATNPRRTTFEPLGMPTMELVDFIRREWLALGRPPGTGYVCWFRATPAGERLAHDLDLKGY